MVKEIIIFLRKNTPYNYIFGGNDKIEDCIVYEYEPGSNNGIKKTARLKLNIITLGIGENSIIKSENIKTDISEAIITKGDNQLSKNILSVTQNGGGTAINLGTNTFHQFLYYDIIYK